MTKGHFVRAILESVVCLINRNIQIMKQQGIYISDIQVLGGGSKSRLWVQMLTDMTGIPVHTLMISDNAATGAAILAGVGTGMFEDLSSACKVTIKSNTRFEPDPLMHERFKMIYSRYLQLYQSLELFW
jgi:xylulokinase